MDIALEPLLKKMVDVEASDLYLSTGAKPSVKIYGRLVPLDEHICEKGEVRKLAYSVMNSEQISQFEKRPEMNLAISYSGVGRFRVNIFVQRAEISMVIRSIHTSLPSMESLGLPPIMPSIAMEKRGLVLIVGATGSGKSTTLAAMVNLRNENSEGHIITIEDPIEFVHKHKKCIVNQREVGVDTESYEDALRNTLRQAPDVILIGEIRTRETMEHAIAFSETGHLCLSTMHANNANQALDRIINFFPEDRRNQLLLDLSFNLKAIVSQRLVPTIDQKRVAAIEILLGTPLVLDIILRGEIEQLKSLMEKSTNLGMQTFDQALEALYFDKKISFDEALHNADSKTNLRLHINLKEKGELTLEPTEGKNANSKKPSDDNSQFSLIED